MCIIICNLNMFAMDQAIQVFDTESERIIYSQGAKGDDLAPTLCALAKKLNTTEIRIGGMREYAIDLIEEIKTAYSLNYGQNDLNVEVI